MPKGINADGSPKKRPVNSGKKAKPHKVKGPYRLALDVVDILEKQPDATAYIEEAVRLKNQTDANTKPLP